MSCYIGHPDMIQSLASPPFSGCFTRLCADYVKSLRLHRPPMDASLGFAPTMWRADLIAHHMPSPVPFHSLQALFLLATQWLVRALVKLLGGSPVGALQFHSKKQSHWSSGSIVCFPTQGAAVRALGVHLNFRNWDSPVNDVSLQYDNYWIFTVSYFKLPFNFVERLFLVLNFLLILLLVCPFLLILLSLFKDPVKSFYSQSQKSNF